MTKTLHNSELSGARVNVPDLEVVGEDLWTLLCKVSSKKEGWMKSTKVMEIRTLGEYGSVQGCLVQVTTQQHDHVAEALVYIPGIAIERNEDGGGKLFIIV